MRKIFAATLSFMVVAPSFAQVGFSKYVKALPDHFEATKVYGAKDALGNRDMSHFLQAIAFKKPDKNGNVLALLNCTNESVCNPACAQHGGYFRQDVVDLAEINSVGSLRNVRGAELSTIGLSLIGGIAMIPAYAGVAVCASLASFTGQKGFQQMVVAPGEEAKACQKVLNLKDLKDAYGQEIVMLQATVAPSKMGDPAIPYYQKDLPGLTDRLCQLLSDAEKEIKKNPKAAKQKIADARKHGKLEQPEAAPAATH
ncbi:MAG: hypothetical protein JST16_15210 [Bdellovibrionales bacterium]|nr:hypothetical protein [Bdellovibrionales bacterium]